MVIGWNRIAPGLLAEVDRLVPSGSTVSVVCDSDLVTAEEIVVPSLERLSVHVTRVPEPELEVVAALPISAARRSRCWRTRAWPRRTPTRSRLRS
jgi:hypothetical protein